MFAVQQSDAVNIWVWLGPTITMLASAAVTLVGGIVLWLKADAAIRQAQATAVLAKIASDKSDASHEIVKDIKELAVKTEMQTNNRLSELDAKVREHELRCVQSQKESADQQRQIAQLELALERAKKHSP